MINLKPEDDNNESNELGELNELAKLKNQDMTPKFKVKAKKFGKTGDNDSDDDVDVNRSPSKLKLRKLNSSQINFKQT